LTDLPETSTFSDHRHAGPTSPPNTALTKHGLAGAIQHYAAHPEHRAAIGTSEEHARLSGALAGGG
ncbi:hypothetical protein ACWENR_11705, partial [Micromonospora sp. NPDC004336]